MKNKNILLGLKNKKNNVKTYLKNIVDAFDIDKMHSVEVINTIVRLWLLQKINRKYLSTIEPVNAIFWNRILGSIPNEKHKNIDRESCEKYVKPVLQFMNVNRMIIGHTPQFAANQSGINTACDSSLYRVDVGGSDAFDIFDSEYLKTKNPMK